jgi:hypothetical protein
MATGSVLAPSLLALGTFGCLESNLASTFPTLPGGGSTSRSFASRSVMIGVAGRCGMGFMGLYRAAASRAAMLEGEGIRSKPSSGTARVLELLDLPSGAVSLAQQCLHPRTITYSAYASARARHRAWHCSSRSRPSNPASTASQCPMASRSAKLHPCLLWWLPGAHRCPRPCTCWPAALASQAASKRRTTRRAGRHRGHCAACCRCLAGQEACCGRWLSSSGAHWMETIKRCSGANSQASLPACA